MKKPQATNPELSVIILSYNTRRLLDNCLESLAPVREKMSLEVIVVDNASSDDSALLVTKKYPWAKLIVNKTNLGFAAGNNVARNYIRGKYILFLNSDTVVSANTVMGTLEYLKGNKSIGALTCRINLPDGRLDKDARRSFINPWIGLTHLFLKLDRIFPQSKLFARYWYGYLSADITHDVDVIQGAYFLVRKTVLDRVGWFDTDYFLDGEDIDLCWRIKKTGWRIVYYPEYSIIHIKGASKGKTDSVNKHHVPFADKLKFRLGGVSSMEMFYKKHLWERYPLLLNLIVMCGILVLKVIRITRTIILG